MEDTGDKGSALIMPQWKRDLILRRRAAAAASNNHYNQSNSKQLSVSSRESECFGSVEFGTGTGHQPNTSCAVISPGSLTAASERVGTAGAFGACGKCDCNKSTCSTKMVQERTWTDNKQIVYDMVANGADKTIDSDSSEELQYGPGIVNKLKNRYLSLTLRECNAKVRPSILRKATSLENLLDDDGPNDKPNERIFEPRTNGNAKNVPQRYRNSTRGSDMKRARSVEAISRTSDIIMSGRPKSLHEDVFIIAKEGNDKTHRKGDNIENAENKYTSRKNRPLRIQPVMNEKEKPPADVVKEKKKIFEARPEHRTRPPHHTGDVAAKVATYKSIIIQNKPPLKQKPPNQEKPRKVPPRLPVKSSWIEKKDVKSPTEIINPDIWKSKPKSPDVTPQIQSPIPDVSMINEEINEKTIPSLSETPDLILHSSPVHAKLNDTSPPPSPSEIIDKSPQESQNNISKASNSITFDFNKSKLPPTPPKPEPKIPPSQPLKLEINGTKSLSNNVPVLKTSPSPTIALSPREIEKNFINTAKSLDVIKSASATDNEKCDVPKVTKKGSKPKQEEQNCIVFNFADRKDVPDYILNDGSVRTSPIQRPKAGEGGITLLPGATYDESFTDYEEELRSLEGPPSPCDVNFINDNILIDGRSSLSQKTKKKMRIQFVEAVPQIFEYPSEASMLLDDNVQSPTPISTSMGHAVPSLSGSSLANYTPKSGMSDEFQLGVTKTVLPEVKLIDDEAATKRDELDETDQPILFSSGTNTDILF